VDETTKLWMKVQLSIQICVFSSKKEGYHLEIGSNLAISSTEKVRIYRQKFPPKKKYRHFGELSRKKKLLVQNISNTD
jgi:ribosomal protein L13